MADVTDDLAYLLMYVVFGAMGVILLAMFAVPAWTNWEDVVDGEERPAQTARAVHGVQDGEQGRDASGWAVADSGREGAASPAGAEALTVAAIRRSA